MSLCIVSEYDIPATLYVSTAMVQICRYGKPTVIASVLVYSALLNGAGRMLETRFTLRRSGKRCPVHITQKLMQIDKEWDC